MARPIAQLDTVLIYLTICQVSQVASHEETTMTTNNVGELHASRQAKVHVGNYYSSNMHVYNKPNTNRCLADLLLLTEFVSFR